MGRMLSPSIRELQPGLIAYWCPGCKSSHHIPIDGSRGWTMTGPNTAPTIRPSVLSRGVRHDLTDEEMNQYEKDFPDPIDREAVFKSKYALICHHWVTNGKLVFLGDCSHDLKNQTVEIPTWPSHFD